MFKSTFRRRHLKSVPRPSMLDVFGWIKAGEVLSNDLFCLIAFDTGCAAVPGDNISIRIEHDDCVILYRFHHHADALVAVVNGPLGLVDLSLALFKTVSHTIKGASQLAQFAILV